MDERSERDSWWSRFIAWILGLFGRRPAPPAGGAATDWGLRTRSDEWAGGGDATNATAEGSGVSSRIGGIGATMSEGADRVTDEGRAAWSPVRRDDDVAGDALGRAPGEPASASAATGEVSAGFDEGQVPRSGGDSTTEAAFGGMEADAGAMPESRGDVTGDDAAAWEAEALAAAGGERSGVSADSFAGEQDAASVSEPDDAARWQAPGAGAGQMSGETPAPEQSATSRAPEPIEEDASAAGVSAGPTGQSSVAAAGEAAAGVPDAPAVDDALVSEETPPDDGAVIAAAGISTAADDVGTGEKPAPMAAAAAAEAAAGDAGMGAPATASTEPASPDDEAVGLLAAPARAAAGGTAGVSEAATGTARVVEGMAGAAEADASGKCPHEYPIKGNASSKIYHMPDQSSYQGTKAEFCFATEADAVGAGYRPRGGGRPAPAVAGKERGEAPPAASAQAPSSAALDDGPAVGVAAPAPAAEAGAVDPAAPAGGDVEAALDVPAGAVPGDGSKVCPPEYAIKGNASSLIYHMPGQAAYDVTEPEYCFATEADATAAGYRAAKR